MAPIWPKNWTLNNFLLFGMQNSWGKFEPFHASRSKDIVEIAKNGPIMDQTLPQYGINKWTLEKTASLILVFLPLFAHFYQFLPMFATIATFCHFMSLFSTFCHFLPLFATFATFCHFLPPFATCWHFCHSCRLCHFLPFLPFFPLFVTFGGGQPHIHYVYIYV